MPLNNGATGLKGWGVFEVWGGGGGGGNVEGGMTYCEVTGAPKLTFPLGVYAEHGNTENRTPGLPHHHSNRHFLDERIARISLCEDKTLRALRCLNNFAELLAEGRTINSGLEVKTSERRRAGIPYRLDVNS